MRRFSFKSCVSALLLAATALAPAHAQQPNTAAAPPAAPPSMVKLEAIWELQNSNEALDAWYRSTHSKESLLFVGPWLRRYWSYKSLDVPAEADRFNVVRYRNTEMWYASLADRKESQPVFFPLTGPPQPPAADRAKYANRTRIANMYVFAVPSEKYIDGWPRQRPSYIRWLFFARYPQNVSVADGEKWFANVHAPELAKAQGVRRFVCYKTAEPPAAGAWVRACEMWFDDYAAWKQAMMVAPPKFTPPSWGGTFPFHEIISTFTDPQPDMDFFRDSDGPR